MPCLVPWNWEEFKSNLIIIIWEALSRYLFQFMGSKQAVKGNSEKVTTIHISEYQIFSLRIHASKLRIQCLDWKSNCFLPIKLIFTTTKTSFTLIHKIMFIWRQTEQTTQLHRAHRINAFGNRHCDLIIYIIRLAIKIKYQLSMERITANEWSDALYTKNKRIEYCLP